MPRATNAPASRRRRKRMILGRERLSGWRSKKYRYAKDAFGTDSNTASPIARTRKALIALSGRNASTQPVAHRASPTAAS